MSAVPRELSHPGSFVMASALKEGSRENKGIAS